MQLNQKTYMLSKAEKPGKIALIVGIVGLALSLLGYFTNPAQFFHSYLAAFAFWTSLSLGGLFFVMLQHLTSSVWSITLRRIPESLMAVLPLMICFFLPIAMGLPHLYKWSHSATLVHDELVQKKVHYLNPSFFLIRAALYFVIWYALARILYRTSLQQDRGADAEQIQRMRRTSALGMVLFAFSVTFASVDWLMSLDAHWYSTIFGVYFFTGCLVGMIAFITIVAILLRWQGILSQEITVEHYHDLGKLTFTFMILWAYMSFSQYFLIWYANLPEETVWFKRRWEGSWRSVTLLLVFGHFVIPFVLLMSRAAKRNLTILVVVSLWFLIMHWVDLYWIIQPNLHKDGATLAWVDLTTLAGIGGIFFWRFWRLFSQHPISPLRDPKLAESIHFINN